MRCEAERLACECHHESAFSALSLTPHSSRLVNPFHRGGKIMLGIAWVLILGGLYWYFSDWQAREANPNPASVIDVQRGELTLTRNRGAITSPTAKSTAGA